MKKNSVWIVILTCALLLVITFFTISGKKPFEDLNASEIVSATVHLVPPDKTIQIIEIQKLVEYLKDVVIYHEDNSYVEYDGQGVTFSIIKTDGTQLDVMAYNPFIVIDGIGYKSKYASCEALSSYANTLLREAN